MPPSDDRHTGLPLQPLKKFIQLHDSYIVAQIDEGFMIIDQHALHERILYEDLCRKIAEGNLESQRLLIPESFEVTTVQIQAMEQNNDLISKLGIALEPFRPKGHRYTGVSDSAGKGFAGGICAGLARPA